MDTLTNMKLRREIRGIHDKTRATTIHVTHDFEEIMGLAHKVAIMQEGRIVQFDAPKQLLKDPSSKFVSDFVNARD
ncbi:MAG: hypothetical protein ABH852_05405 [Methanobacteriota archaeon]